MSPVLALVLQPSDPATVPSVDIGLNNLDGFALLDDGSILMSFTRAQAIDILTDVDDSAVAGFGSMIDGFSIVP